MNRNQMTELEREIVDLMGEEFDTMAVAFHVPSRRVIMIQGEYINEAEEYGTDDEPELEDEEMREAFNYVNHPDEYLSLPDRYDVNEYGMMRHFIEMLDNDRHAEQLARAINGRGAFRHFKNTADDLGIIEDWYEFRDAEYLRIARDWLEENHLTDKKL